MAVPDKSLNVLLAQLNAHAPNRSKESDGWIGDEDHQGRESAHNPEDTKDSMDGNDPDDQVDARDFTHDPDSGADMAQMTEELRVSRDNRLYLVIFNGRQFSSYARDGHPPFTWRPYYGTNKHTKHAHVEVNDYHNDVTRPWKVFVMADSPAVVSTEWRVWFLSQLQESGKNPANGVMEKYPLVTLLKAVDAQVKSNGEDLEALKGQIAELKGMLKVQGEQILALSRVTDDIASDIDALTIPQPAPVDPETLQPVVEAGVRAVLRDGVDHA